MIYRKDILFGQIIKTNGFEGAVTVRLEKKYIGNIPHMESVFLEVEGRPVPFFISSLEYQEGDSVRLSFEGYDSVARVAGFTGSNVYLTGGEYSAEENPLKQLNGYSLINSENVLLGTISSIIANPGQMLLEIITGSGEELLVPLHEDLIISIDNELRVLKMEIPEGLIDLNQKLS